MENLKAGAKAYVDASRQAKQSQKAKHRDANGDASRSQSSKTPSTSKKAKMPNSRLSFGEELDGGSDEDGASFSLAQSTNSRFQEERKRAPLLNPVNAAAANGVRSIIPVLSDVSDQLSHKANQRPHLGQIICGAAQARGPRPYMEDRYTFISSYAPLNFDKQPVPDDVQRSFAAVYDGHNGAQAADYAKERLHTILAQEQAMRDCRGEVGVSPLPWGSQASSQSEYREAQAMSSAVKHAFHLVDKEILDRCRQEKGRDGSCALMILRIGEVMWAAHAGDSRAVLCRGGQSMRLTEDHKPELPGEKARIEANGGRVEMQRCWRVICPAANGRPASGLAVSRSFGDLDFKEPARYVESEPDVNRLRILPEDKFIIMASDGLWDVIEDQESIAIVQEHLAESQSTSMSKAALDVIAKDAASRLLEKAAEKKSMDNMTALVLLLQWS